jgi:YfiR/HmsC-like
MRYRGVLTLSAFRRACLFGTWVIVSSAPHSVVRAQSPSEYQIKAVFLYNFAKFVEWPSDPGGNPGSISICVLGDDPFGGTLDEAIKGKTVNGRELVARRYKQVEETTHCQIVFIGSSNKKVLRPILESLKGESTLTVGETEGFARLGGMINFTLEESRVHFEINVDAADHARLKISSKLLNLAKIVREGGKGGQD